VNKGCPTLLDKAAQIKGVIGDAAQASGSDAVVMIPVLVEDKVSELLALYL
jgi:hypothetical protein